MKLKRTIVTLLSVLMISLSSTAAEEVTPDDVIQACEEALNACDSYAQSLEDVIKAQDLALAEAAKTEARLRRQRDSIFRNPFVWGAVGLVLGVVIVR